MTLHELLKTEGLTDEQIEKVLTEMKQNKIFTAGEENLDIRYGKLKTDNDSLRKQYSEAQALIEELKKSGEDNMQEKITAFGTYTLAFRCCF